MTTIHFEYGEFGTTVVLEMLPTLPANNIRKLLRLMLTGPSSNAGSIHTFTNWLPGAVSDAKNTWGYAVALYKDGYRAIPKGYRSVGATQQRQKNRALANSVKSARVAYNQLVKMQSIFDKIKEKMNYA